MYVQHVPCGGVSKRKKKKEKCLRTKNGLPKVSTCSTLILHTKNHLIFHIDLGYVMWYTNNKKSRMYNWKKF